MTGLGDRLAVGDLRLADGGVHLELAEHAVDDHLEVELAHAGDDGLAGLLVGADLEGRVLLGQGEEGLAHLVLVDLGLRLHGDVDHGLGELEVLEHDLVARGGQRVAGAGVLEPDAGGDVAGEHGVDVLAAGWRASGGCGRCAPCCCWWCSPPCRPSRAMPE